MPIIDRLRKRSPFGSKVIGEEAAKFQKSEMTKNRRKFGPKVRGTSPTLPGTQQLDPATTPVVASRKPGEGMLSLKSLEKVLDENPHLLNAYVEQESTRLPHPRVQALEYMLKVAKKAGNDKAEAAITAQLANAKKAAESVATERNAPKKGAAKKAAPAKGKSKEPETPPAE